MSVLDSFFSKGFKGARCKTLLKLTIPRIKLLRNRREIQLKQMRRDIAKLLENGQEATARIRVEHIIREENMMAAQEILELFCELIAVRLPIIETQRECPLDLKEAISSICFAAPRCADLPELQQVQMLFVGKYGKEFVSAATELRPDCGVNRQIIELLSVRAPPVEAKMKLLQEIAEEHEIDWDPTASETEYLKPHEDLLNGPSHLISGSTLPLPKEKHDESLSLTPVGDSETLPEVDVKSGFDSLDLPEVPKVSVRPSLDSVSAPETIQPAPSSPPELEFGHENTKSTPSNEETLQKPSLKTEVASPGSLVPPQHSHPNSGSDVEAKQFVPFVYSPPSATSFPAEDTKSTPLNEDVLHKPCLEPEVATPETLVPPQCPSPGTQYGVEATKGFVPCFSSPISAALFPPRKPQQISSFSESAPSLSRTRSDANEDLQDVLAAAQAAAESAERAAAAARSAASLAQVRITDLVSRRNGRDSEWRQVNTEDSTQSGVEKDPTYDQQHLFGHASDDGPGWNSNMPIPSSLGTSKLEYESPSSMDQQTAHQPQRSTSLEDDPYFSYPNLFARQDSNLRAGHSSTNNL